MSLQWRGTSIDAQAASLPDMREAIFGHTREAYCQAITMYYHQLRGIRYSQVNLTP